MAFIGEGESTVVRFFKLLISFMLKLLPHIISETKSCGCHGPLFVGPYVNLVIYQFSNRIQRKK